MKEVHDNCKKRSLEQTKIRIIILNAFIMSRNLTIFTKQGTICRGGQDGR